MYKKKNERKETQEEQRKKSRETISVLTKGRTMESKCENLMPV